MSRMKTTKISINKDGEMVIRRLTLRRDLSEHLTKQSEKRELSIKVILEECIQYHRENAKT